MSNDPKHLRDRENRPVFDELKMLFRQDDFEIDRLYTGSTHVENTIGACLSERPMRANTFAFDRWKRQSLDKIASKMRETRYKATDEDIGSFLEVIESIFDQRFAPKEQA